MRVQHKTKRGGFALVADARYQLDDSGQVEVSDDHGAMMVQGANWSAVKAAKPKPEPGPDPLGTLGILEPTLDVEVAPEPALDVDTEPALAPPKSKLASRAASRTRRRKD